MLKCPLCNSEDIVYIQAVKEWWAVDKIDENGYVEFIEVIDKFTIESIPEELYCHNCKSKLTIEEYLDKKKALGLKD